MPTKPPTTDFSSLTKGLNVIGITETHAASEQDVQRQGYHHFAVVRRKATLARSHSDGIAVLVENFLAPFASMCDWSNPCCLAIKIKASTSSPKFCRDRNLTNLNG